MGEQYAYMQVADDLERRINVGEIEIKLPSERDLAEDVDARVADDAHRAVGFVGDRREREIQMQRGDETDIDNIDVGILDEIDARPEQRPRTPSLAVSARPRPDRRRPGRDRTRRTGAGCP